ncbi:hypothetical protein GWO43_09720 [candidate division KSB1 bacterium]|nr:hypothetical protein [candidate division KSB1 bacterium]NIR72273.1 hypothetical protein [candidate division KSB1 bacterium]NIS24244.1 hypothetical protein [candidate division KSB1 bacterium]NIT71159.1 hypothetical protein [candidate division KSB1 bacterium]NIU24863.1 hypothetical protein [candidate division KSB1 bacterium]
MFELKPISKKGVKEAMEKAERYRLLNEPRLAESICLDILEVDPENQRAIIILLLALTDQFGKGRSVDVNDARQLLPRLKRKYDREYYAGIICERQGKATLNQGIPGAGHIAYAWLRNAMEHFEKAESIRPTGNDDSILRWNTCVRLIERDKLEPRPEEPAQSMLE